MKDQASLIIRIGVSLIVTLVLAFLFLSFEQPYRLNLVDKIPIVAGKTTTFFDLDSDGLAEKISLSTSTSRQLGIVVFDHNNGLIDQYNLLGDMVKHSNIFKGDFDRDGLHEMYVFTYSGDSLFLNVVDIYSEEGYLIRRKYIEGCKSLHGEAQYAITGAVFQDSNNDGFEEFYFSVRAGFTLQPRAMFCYDIYNNIYSDSGPSGSAPASLLSSYDLDGDGKEEIWGYSNAVGNFKTEIPQSDSSTWLMIYKHNLDLMFDPPEFEGYSSSLISYVMNTGADTILVVLRLTGGIDENDIPELMTFSVRGEQLAHQVLDVFGIDKNLQLYIRGERIYLKDLTGTMLIFDQNLDLVRKKKKDEYSGFIYGPFSGNEKDVKQVIFLNKDGKLQLMSTSLKNLSSINLGEYSHSYYIPVPIRRIDIESGLHLRTARYDYTFSITHNNSRNFIYLYIVLLFTGFYVIIYFIQRQQLLQEEKKRKQEARLRTLQMQAAKSQMSPHFIFNALNSISAMYIKGDTERADAFLNSFSKMIREVVDSSDRLVVRIEEEIEFVRHYLELEQVRHEGSLSFSFSVNEDCKMLEIPSMSIHTFVENSIKHGFRAHNRMNVQIKVARKDTSVLISIKDDGSGYTRTKIAGERQGRGLKIIEDIFDTYYRVNGKKATFSIKCPGSEKSDNKGTLVKITVQI